jgi:hypothetical protein
MNTSKFPMATRAAATYDAELAKRPTLVYIETGKPVAEGDKVVIHGQRAIVDYFPLPHKSASSGKVTVVFAGRTMGDEFFVSVIDAVWINRPDRETPVAVAPAVQTVPVSKLTARMLAEGLGVRTMSFEGKHFLVDTLHSMAKYRCVNLETQQVQPCTSVAEVKEWLFLN